MSQNISNYHFGNFTQLQSQPEPLHPLWDDPPSHQPLNRTSRSSSRVVPESKLLQTAVEAIRQKHEQQEALAIESIIQQNQKKNSSREVHNNSVVGKKKHKHQTLSSQLFDIESQGTNNQDDEETKFKYLIMEDHRIGLSEAIHLTIIGKERKVNDKLIHSWKECLLHEDKVQIYGDNAKYTYPRIFAINELEKGFNQIYGKGKKRCLTMGEQALLIYHMEKYLEKCTKEPKKFGRKSHDIVNEIIKTAKLNDIQYLPFGFKQAQLLWKAFATRWRYSGNLDLKSKEVQNALAIGLNNILELNKDTPLTNLLLAHSNWKSLSKTQQI